MSAVLKLCDWLKVKSAGECMEDGRAAVQAEAEAVQQRWHSVWIQSVEWQLRLEDAVSGRTVRRRDVYIKYLCTISPARKSVCWPVLVRGCGLVIWL